MSFSSHCSCPVTFAIDPGPRSSSIRATPAARLLNTSTLPTRCGRAASTCGAATPMIQQQDRQPSRLAGCRRRHAPHLPRLRAFADSVRDAASPTSSCSAWADRASPRGAARASSASRPAFRASACSIRSIPTRCATPWRSRRRRCSSSPASRDRRSSPTSWRPKPSADSAPSPASPTWIALRRDHRRKHGASAARSRRALPRDLSSIPPTSAAATRRSRSSAWCRRR